MSYHFFETKKEITSKLLGQKEILEDLKYMLLIRHFESRAEVAYQAGRVGGFFHSYAGQEAIQVAAVRACGLKDWYSTSYRCHALALLLGASPDELMAELYGRETGNVKGRGGSMHFYTETLLGGFGIVGGQIPIGTGAAFTCKYLGQKERISLCFMGEGAVAQGAFHESLNIASLWELPCLYIIENNKWGMGTSVDRAISVHEIAEKKAIGYGMQGYTINGMDYLHCYEAFHFFKEEIIRTGKPILVEAITERFKGHSISDPAAYRDKNILSTCIDPIITIKQLVLEKGLATKEEIGEMDKEMRLRVIASMKYAEESPWPNITTLEEGVFAP
ncbi:MAG: thiamine pyrophosphate-dependent enzyme [Chlamydiae bacterium]|nr:thiamine pyrophosphate-dependent enzyme [Chlamydiota bacterium]